MLLIHLKKIFRLLIVFVLGLTLANLAIQGIKFFLGYETLLGLVRLFDVNEENNIPTWYSSTALLFSSLLLFLISVAKQQQNDKYTPYWRGLSTIFLLLSLDETSSFHELFIQFGSAFNARGILFFFWVIPGMIFVLTVALIYLKFLMALPAKIRHLFFVAGITYLMGSIGFEMVGGYYFDTYIRENPLTVSTGISFSMALILAIEEFLEMLGVLVFIYALLSYIRLERINIGVHSRGYTFDVMFTDRDLVEPNFLSGEAGSKEI